MIRRTLLYGVVCHQRSIFPRGTWSIAAASQPSRLRTLNRDSATSLNLERIRFFCNTRPLGKKNKSKGSTLDFSHSDTAAAAADPLDLSLLHDGIAEALQRLKDDFSKLRAGGRLNPEVIENLRVHLKGGKESVRLGDLAQVIPKGGRMLTIMVGEEDVSCVGSNNSRPFSRRFSQSSWSLKEVAHECLSIGAPDLTGISISLSNR
jgi:ribosome recycling factor